MMVSDGATNPPPISVVIPAYNAAHSITDCMNALQRQCIDHPFEVILVDDGSTDETGKLAAEAGAIVVRKERGRPAAARNAGIQAARGDIICFTDADCEPHDNWLHELTLPCFTDPDTIGGKGIYDTKQREIVARFVQLEYEDKYDLLMKHPTIDFIDTYSAVYRRDVLVANDCFDEQFPYLEDQELSFRLAARGYKMVFIPSAVVYHLHSNTLYRYVRKKLIIGYWKAQVVRRFPTQGVKDSHTPQVMKIQMGLMALLLALIPMLLFTSWSAIPLALVALAFLGSTLPFVRKAWPKDRTVALASPLMLAVRALALGLGYAGGLVKPQLAIDEADATIGGASYIAKRGMDIVGALVGLLVTAVIGPFIAIAIKLDSPGPVIFKQERIGQGGRPFTVYKFRSMRANAEHELESLIDFSQLTEPVFKLENDPRLTRVGKVLRRWSLDELPQFWNVLKGDMSLIGPRPEEARMVALYNDWHRRRLAIKPGLTGPMQVNGRADLPLDMRVQLELDYIENYSFWRDIKILFQTVPAVMSGAGAR